MSGLGHTSKGLSEAGVTGTVCENCVVECTVTLALQEDSLRPESQAEYGSLVTHNCIWEFLLVHSQSMLLHACI